MSAEPFQPIVPAHLEHTESGTPYSAQYGDVYFSAAGGPGQARHVFIDGNRLTDRWAGRPGFTILETGFGTGLNFLTTWQTWRDDPRRPQRLHYLALEKHPFQSAHLAKLHEPWPDFSPLSSELRARWPTLTPGFHRLELAGGRIILTLLLGDAARTLPRLRASVDAIFLDGFSPERNPEMWAPALFKHLARLCGPETTLATWSVAGAVRQGLQDAGFALEKRPGYGHKRDMLTGYYAPPPYRRPAAALLPRPQERTVLVVGAGLAGAACCERLAARGWEITLLDRHPGPAREASGNHAGLALPLVSVDDNLPSRLSRAAFLYGLKHWENLAGQGRELIWNPCGVLQLARDGAQETLQSKLADAMAFPHEFLRYLDAQQASQQAGAPTPRGGWWFPQGAWVNPPSLCRAYLEQAGHHLTTLYNCSVAQLQATPEGWLALDADRRPRARAAHVVLASGAALETTAPWGHIPHQAIRGQVTLVPEGRLPSVRTALCREGYLTPAVQGWHCAGASYDHGMDQTPSTALDDENWARVRRLLTGLPETAAWGNVQSRVGFRAVAPDRLPLVGPLAHRDPSASHGATQLAHLARQDGMYSVLGFASRGLVWSALMAEHLASLMEGDPLPLESDLAAAIDPGRFLLKVLKSV